MKDKKYPCEQCDEACYYHCTKGGQQEPECVNNKDMTPEERQQYIDICLRINNIQLHHDILELVIKSVDLVDKKKGNTDICDALKLKNKK